MAEITYPFTSDIYYEVETSYGNGIVGGSEKRISDSVTDVRIGSGDITRDLRSIDSADVAEFSKTLEDPTLHVEWVYQPNTSGSLVSYCYNRGGSSTSAQGCGDLYSLAFEIPINDCRSEASYFEMKGCKCTTFTVSSTKGEHYTVTADFSVSDIAINSSAQGTAPAVIDTDFATFNVAGGITWSGVTGAYVTESVDFTVDNGITDYHDVGSTSKQAAIPGQRSITGSCDISIDDGAGNQFQEVLDGTAITSLVLNTGETDGDFGTFTLSDGVFESIDVDISTGGEGLISSVPFKFTGLSFSTGT